MKQASVTKSLTVAFPKEVFQKIREITNQQRISMSDWIRGACEKSLEDDVSREKSSMDIDSEPVCLTLPNGEKLVLKIPYKMNMSSVIDSFYYTIPDPDPEKDEANLINMFRTAHPHLSEFSIMKIFYLFKLMEPS